MANNTFKLSAIDGHGGAITTEITASSVDEAVKRFPSLFQSDTPMQITSIAEFSTTGDPKPVAVTLKRAGIFGAGTERATEDHIQLAGWSHPVQYFVGRNGSGKSKTANAIATAAGGRILATDRLIGLMNVDNYGWGLRPAHYRGVPLGEDERAQILEMAREAGLATSELFALREEPEVLLRVAAFIRRSLGRTIEIRETAGFLDPYIQMGSTEYSLLRDEGHGLRELVVLLAAIYRSDWHLLVVDEPELHLHPSMARLWLGELNRECESTSRSAIVVTHEPSFLRPRRADDLAAIWMFSAESGPRRMIDSVLEVQKDRVASSLAQNPQLVSDIVFSPRPVLLEGVTDVAAMSTALSRISAPEVVAQTDLVDCGGSGGVALWLEICTNLRLDVRGVCDLDALFDQDMQRTIDSLPGVKSAITTTFAESPARISTVLQPLIRAANAAKTPSDPASRGAWLARIDDASKPDEEDNAERLRKSRLLRLLRNHGLWAHSQGTLEQVLGIAKKGAVEATAAASSPCDLDSVATWAAYELDLRGDVEHLLGGAVEKVAHSIMEALRDNPTAQFHAPVGPSAQADARLVNVIPVKDGVHRLEVIAPIEFAGWWLEFSRESRATELNLRPRT
ncbi:ATP-binding protein [Microbacterium profundi]|uniref:ATP-dependent nuclease n=1 Tax=Microbacterium profundi TaxID=450380 RepID=UPI001F1FADD7|nr:AAA family ATPase [Microbacterium profundi]MCE7482741.1 ATP-binding protein [Microbacterium profundi]